VQRASGVEVARLDGTGHAGINRVVWDLRHSEPEVEDEQDSDGGPPGGGPGGGFGGFERRGPLVAPGTYTVRVTVLDETAEGSIEVREDPRIAAKVDPDARAAWTAMLLEIAGLRRDARALSRRVQRALRDAQAETEGTDEEMDDRSLEVLEVLRRETGELASRIGRLEGEAEDIVGPLTGEQASQWTYFQEMYEALSREAELLLQAPEAPEPPDR
jgi:hypothetical protein